MVDPSQLITLIETVVKERDEALKEISKLQIQILNLEKELREKKEEIQIWKKISNTK